MTLKPTRVQDDGAARARQERRRKRRDREPLEDGLAGTGGPKYYDFREKDPAWKRERRMPTRRAERAGGTEKRGISLNKRPIIIR